jgi:transposase InsO family protein
MMEFANQVERKFDAKIIAIRSDNGTEFKNYTLDDFLGEEGIQHQYSSTYTPQQNGVTERKNRTLIEAARTMIMEYKSPYNFWTEAISTACHATNRLYFRKGRDRIRSKNYPDACGPNCILMSQWWNCEGPEQQLHGMAHAR